MTRLLDSELVGRTLGKRYLVRRVIGAGGMGAVFEAEHVFTKRTGALKLLHQSVAALPEVVERFVREASAAGRIGNPHIVETIDAGELDTGEPYIFMELLSGMPLSELIRVRHRLPFEEALEIAAQAAEGLAAAHEAGIVHRDIKPENLFVCAGETPFVKILDFGISKFTENDALKHRLTHQGSAMGTPYYMSPEQVVGERNIDARTDVYSLGVVLYECVSGQTPFDAESLPALSVRIHEGKYVPPSQLRPDAPAGFDALVARAMAVARDDRFATMAAFLDALATRKRAPISLSAVTSGGVPARSGALLGSASMFGETSPSGPPDDGSPPSASPPAGEGTAPGPAARRAWRAPALIATGAALVGWAVLHASDHGAPSSAPAAASKSTSLPEIRAVVSSPLPLATPPASAPSNAPAASVARPAAPRNKASKARPASSSQAQKDGLSEKNPFAEP